MARQVAASALRLFLLVLLVAACTDGRQMRLQLAGLEARNRADSLMTDDSLAQALADYFDRHGTPNEQMRAHYILARTYTDLGEAPRALDEYHRAAAKADTTASDCDYKTLSRVHGQTAELFYSMLLPNETLEELRRGYRYAQKANDTVTRLIAYERQSYAYDLIGKKDSAYIVLQKAHQNYLNHGYDGFAANCAAPLAMYLLEQQKWQEARRYIDIFEKGATYFVDGSVLPGHEMYYYIKGNFFVGIGKRDSAEHYFRRIICQTSDSINLSAAYKGLYKLFKDAGRTDSVAKYADLYCTLNDTLYVEKTIEKLQHMQALYNYERNQSLAQQKEQEALDARNMLIFTLMLSSLIFVIIGWSVWSWHQKKKQQMDALARQSEERIANLIKEEQQRTQTMKDEQHRQLEMIEKANHELLQMKEKAYDRLILAKEEEITIRKKEIEQLQQQLTLHANARERFLNTPAFAKIRYYANNPKEKVKKSDINLFLRTAEAEFPSFYHALRDGKYVNDEDLFLCLLIHSDFDLSDICNLTGLSSVDLSKKRRALLKKWYGISDKPEFFDNKVRQILVVDK
jgi:hypothetical protein